MEIIKEATFDVQCTDPCCGGAYDYDPDSNCIDDKQ